MKIDKDTSKADFKKFKEKVDKMPEGPTKEAMKKDLELKKAKYQIK